MEIDKKVMITTAELAQLWAQSPRMDLGVMYNRLSLEIELFSEDGSNIMINNKWLE